MRPFSPRSVRVRTIAVIILVICAPLIWVWMSGVTDTGWGAKLRWDLNEVSRTLARAALEGDTDAMTAAARWRGVWVRILDGDRVVFDVDASSTTLGPQVFTDAFFGPSGAPTLAQLDATEPPLPARSETAVARREGSYIGCRLTEDSQLLVCTRTLRIADGRVLYVQKSMARAVRSLYEVRFQLLALTLNALLIGGLLGSLFAWRLVRPIRTLEDQVRRRMGPPLSTEPIHLDRTDEYGELATAFNELLAALAARNQANEAFAADLAHELKNPVAAITAATDALARGIPDPARQERLVRIFTASSAQMNTVVTEFLELARAEAGLRTAPREDVRLDTLIEGLVETLRSDPRSASLTIAVAAAPVEVSVAPARIETALRNLLVNAVHFARTEVRVRVSTTGVAAEVSITDDGPGISDADRLRVFDRYFSRRDGGTGIGLALSHALVSAHGGTISVTSTVGEGSTFTVALPTSAATTAEDRHA